MAGRGRELRKAKRTRRRNAAWIVLDGEGGRIPCVLWDISDGGARIAAARANALPAVFCLFLSKDGKTRRYCRVVWRNGGLLGIRFIDEAEADMDLDTPPRCRRHKPAPAAQPASQATRPADVTAAQLVLPGCGPRAVAEREPRAFTFSSVALGLVLLLGAATGLFFFAGMQSADNAAWALEVCGRAENFCRHPEWTVAAAAVMTVVYLAVKGMEL